LQFPSQSVILPADSKRRLAMLELSNYFCPNTKCVNYGVRGKGNLTVHFQYGKQDRRMLYCGSCKTRFSETKCTAFFGSKYSTETISRIVQTTAEGVGVRATARMLGLDKDAVNRVVLNVGEHCEKLLEMLMSQLGLTEVQLDELWTFVKKKVLPKMKAKKRKKEKTGSGLQSMPGPDC
jgi:transposase-like protein